jgi:hypothetical protein
VRRLPAPILDGDAHAVDDDEVTKAGKGHRIDDATIGSELSDLFSRSVI